MFSNLILSVGMLATAAEPDLTLERCLILAKQCHPRLVASANQVQVAEARVGQARSGALPNVEIGLTYARATSNFARIPGLLPESFLTDPTLVTTETDRSFNSLAGVIAAKHTVFDFGRTAGSIEAEQGQVAALQSVRREVERQLAFEVIQEYYRCLQIQQVMAVREEAVKQMTQHLDRAKTQYQVGKRPQTDVTKAEVDVANAKLALIEAVSDGKVAWLGLQQAMGFPTEPLSSRVARRIEPVVAVTLGAEIAVARALEHRPELAAIQLEIRSAEFREVVAQSGFYPTLSTQAQYDWRGQEFPLTHNWYIGMSLTFPVFTGFLATYQVEEARARTAALRAQSKTVTQAVRVEVEQAAAQLQAMAERVKAAEVVVIHATEHLALTQSRYDAGAGSLMDLTDAQMASNAAEVQRIGAQTAYAVAKARWSYAMGELSL